MKTHFFQRLFTSFRGEKTTLIPPEKMIFVGNGDFVNIGNEFLEYFVNYGGLQKTDAVLDVGCGIGRMAVPLTKYLTTEARYEGIDIVPKGITWCKKNITPAYPYFHFQHVDIYNKAYNKKGKYKSSEYRFPYPDESFDFVFLTSVFTHMLPADLENYVSEISRVMKKGGKCLITYFLINQESLAGIKDKKSKFSFAYQFNEHCRLDNEKTPESAIAYREEYIRELYKRNGFSITSPILYGGWSGRKDFLSFQDIIVAHKI
jgi:ubiquinone/menaquinone biosynthesis C-methylase UbiE